MSNAPSAEAPYPSERFDRLAKLSDDDIIRRLRASISSLDEAPYLEFPALPQMLTAPARPAAVLVPLIRADGERRLLYTRRNSGLPEHSGQVAFPGGRADPEDDSPEATALREAYEEIGLAPQDVRILGRMTPYMTITNYLVTPVIAAMPWPYLLRPASEEVSRVFTIPLAWLADAANYEERLRELPGDFGSAAVVYYKPYDGEVLWGASARITQNLLKILSSVDS